MNLDPAFAPALVVAGIGAALDIKDRRLPNWLCALLAIAAAGGLVALEGATALLSALLHASIALIAGMALFKLRMIGGGDAKFYAAAAAGLPLTDGLPFLGWTSVAGVGVLLTTVLGRLARPALRQGPVGRASVPFGVAIFCGFALTLTVS